MKHWHKAVLLYSVLITILFAPVFLHGQSMLLFGDDIHSQHYFFKKFMVDSVHQGILPWWNPYQFSGTPFFANPQVVPLYPLGFIYLLLPLSVAFPLFIFLHLFIGMMGMFVLIRLYVDDISAWTGGVLFGLSGFFIARILSGHLGIIASGAWTPWIVGLWLYAFAKKNWTYAILSSCCVGLQLMAGYQSVTIFTFEILTIVSIGYCISLRSVKPFLTVFLLGIVGIGISAYQMLPIFEFMRLSIRTIPLSFSWATQGASTLSSLAMIFFPFIFGTPSTFTGPPVNYGEHASYLGIIGSSMAFLSVILLFLSYGISAGSHIIGYRYPKKLVYVTWIAIGIVFVGVALALSSNSVFPFHEMVWTIVPLFRTLRIPSRQLYLVVFAGSILGAFGISFIKHTLLKRLLCIAIVLELVLTGSSFITLAPQPESGYDTGLMQSMERTDSLSRILPNYGCWIEPKSSFPFNAPMTKNIFSATGYDPMIYRPYYEFIDATNGSVDSSILINDVQIPYIALFSKAMNFLNISHILTPTYAADPLDGKSTEQYVLQKEHAERKYRVYENTKSFPRFFFVPTILVFDTKDQLASEIREQRIDFQQTAAVVKKDVQNLTFQPDCKAGEKGSVEVLSYTPNTIQLRVSTSCNAFLTSSEVMYPGWTATIDGKRTHILMGNMAFRTVYVPKGVHEITFKFIPYSLYVGSMISLCTLLGIICFYFYRVYRLYKMPRR